MLDMMLKHKRSVKFFYRFSDFDNQPNPFQYGPSNQLVFLSAFDGLNGLRANRTNFKLTHQGAPIYTKSFDPTDTARLIM